MELEDPSYPGGVGDDYAGTRDRPSGASSTPSGSERPPGSTRSPRARGGRGPSAPAANRPAGRPSGRRAGVERAVNGRLAELRVEAGAAHTPSEPRPRVVALRESPAPASAPGRSRRPTPAPEPPADDREEPSAPTVGPPSGPAPRRRLAAPGPRGTRLRLFRVALVLAGLGALAVISTLFGMMMAVAGELPALDNQAEFRAAQNSVLHAGGRPVAKLTGNKNRILLREGDISPVIENAVIAIEDRRFFEHEGVDARGILRALWADLRRGEPVQGASTITQQFVKNALAAQGERTILQKMREAALAYHLERKWSKRKILTQYLNTVYFGNGAYGIESAVRAYFGKSRGGVSREERAASEVEPHEAALLAGIIASPYGYDPIQNPKAARDRRNVVLRRMLDQNMITPFQYRESINEALPAERDIEAPKPDSEVPYFSNWVTQQLVDRYGAGRVFGGGLKVKTTLDPDLQQRAQTAIDSRLPDGGPSASLVAIDNKTGGVKAMVGGENFTKQPFNVATNGHRQPGSALKPFTLITALEQGVSPDRTYSSRKKVLRSREGPFEVNNYQDDYAGIASLRSATTKSDNSVYAELGLEVGTKKIARTAAEMGIRTPLSTNAAMTLGGLEQGVTPLEMAYAYSTIANRGERRSGTMASSEMGPVAIESVRGGDTDDRNHRLEKRVFSRDVGDQARELLRGVVTSGTGKSANPANGEFVAGKTGTTENYGDAWFVGFDDRYTVAVWVGYPDKVRYMKTEYNGGPVAGGTYPAEIFKDFLLAADRLEEERNPERIDPTGPASGLASGSGAGPAGAGVGAGAGAGGGAGAGTGYNPPSAPQAPPTPSPPPSQTPAYSGGAGAQTPQSGTGSSSPSGDGTPGGGF